MYAVAKKNCRPVLCVYEKTGAPKWASASEWSRGLCRMERVTELVKEFSVVAGILMFSVLFCKCPLLDPVLSQLNPMNTLTSLLEDIF
jgi:hypothetical protein